MAEYIVRHDHHTVDGEELLDMGSYVLLPGES